MKTDARHSIVDKLNRDYLILSLVPFISFFVFIFIGAYLAQDHIADLIDNSMHTLKADIEAQMVQDGEGHIHSRAQEAARQMEAYLTAHPGLTIAALQASPAAQSIAVQQVGRTGYTCLYEAGTGVMRLHPNPELIGLNMPSLAAALPSWWSVFEPSLSGREFSGYYQWREEDRRLTQKFMVMLPVRTPLEGRTLMVAATTYLDEFLSPVRFTRERARQIAESYRAYSTGIVWRIGGVMGGILLATLTAVFWLGRRASARFVRPIQELAREAAGFGKTMQASAELAPLAQRSDEIGELAAAFGRMREQIIDQFKKIQSSFEKLWEAQQALSESEDHYRGLFENVPIGIYRSEPGGRVLDVNSALVDMFGYATKQEVLSLPAGQLYVNPEDRKRFMQQVDGSNGLTPLEFQMRRRDGRTIWVENQGIAIRDDHGRIQYYQGTLKDVTERRKAEEELRLARFCLDHAAVAIFRVGDGARILEVNMEACRSLGFSRQELIGRTVFEIDPDFTPEKWANHRRILAREGVRVVQSHHRRKDGSRFPVEVTANFIEKDGSGFSYAFVTDISSRIKAERDREKLESQLQQAQKMEAIGVLAGGIAHDFNNILSVIIGNADMLLLSDGVPENDRFSVEQIQIAATRARQLVKQILTFSRRDEQQRMLINLKSVIQETYDFLRSTLPSSIRVERQIRVDAGSAILANPTQMQQVLMNLCTNAAHAMEHQETGVLEIRIDKATISAEQASFEPGVEPGDFLRLTVSDTGAGIAPEIQHRIFDPYFTTKEQGKGTGLGLSVVHGIVKSHDGFIRLDSEVGRGSAFHIFLPLVCEDAPPEAPASPATLPGGSETLLVVDDEKALVDMTSQMLRWLGYTVETRTSPIEAIEAFKANPGRYDAVITDMTMPQMNGVNLAKTLLGIKPGLPILLCTGFSDQANEQKARAAGIREFAFKPLALSDLAKTLRKMLDHAAGRPEAS